ncbi:MAG: Cof-type HAD-IIB family hydrolase [Candidatus Limivivens sp.]|nr:Cof-type HAD-IIB family hydrolase [Candidatus Limivivens sp.]
MKYQTAVFDLDGTLTNSRKEITPVTKEALMRYQQAGGTVVLASGRPTFGVVPLARILEMEKYGGYILSFNGGMILDCRTGKPIYQVSLGEEIPAKVGAFARAHRAAVLTYENEFLITETPEDLYVQKESAINKMAVKKVKSFGDYVTFPVTKCLMTAEGNRCARLEEILKGEVGDSLSIYRSEPYFLEIMPQGIDKANSLQRLLKHLGRTRETMAAFGDGFNDKGMIAFAGLGVAMQNAQPVVKAAADFVTLSNDEDGVAYVIHKFLNEEDMV